MTSYKKIMEEVARDKKEEPKRKDGLFWAADVTKTKPVVSKKDMVNHPPHYNQYGVECIDAIQACTGKGFSAYLQVNLLKYLCRYDYKNGVEDLKKAEWYLDILIKVKENDKS